MTTNRTTSLLLEERLPHCTSSRTTRRGLTLTEILAATFVLSFGLVAALSVLPFATHLLSRMDVADTSGACGRGALQQIRMAGWQKPDVLITPGFTGSIWSGHLDRVPADPYIVDPLGYVASIQASPTGNPETKFPHAALQEPLLTTTLEAIAGLGSPDDEIAANLHFRWNDDMIFAEDANSTRPTLINRTDTTKQAAGDYTWLYMVTPVIDRQRDALHRVNLLGSVTTDTDNVLGYEVAAVVFHRRDLHATDSGYEHSIRRRFELTKFHNGLNTSEDTINATGAYITLQTDAYPDPGTPPLEPEYINLSSVKWILLTGRSQELHDSVVNGDPLVGTLVAQWYRITGYDDIVPSSSGVGYERRVFLVGPDWKGAKDPINRPPVYAILCDGVVNVFQATMPK